MGLGILEDRHLRHVPGTATLDQLLGSAIPLTGVDDAKDAPATVADLAASLKRSKGPDPVILVPQPSDDPNDPLNWPLWRRDLITAILSLMSVIASTLSPLLAANTLDLDLYFSSNFLKIAHLTGYHLLGVGIAGFIFVPSARIWGKRHCLLLGTVIIIITSIWGGASNHNFASLMAARVFQGVGLAPFEALVNATVGDLYFVHERGKRMALTNLALFGGAFFTPVIVGKMTSTLGWQWTFYFVAIFAALMLPFLICFVPETAFRREQRFDTDTIALAGDEKSAAQSSSSSFDPTQGNRGPTVRQTLPIFSGRKTDEPFLKLMLRPLPLFVQPGIFIACLIQGAMIGWTVFIGIVLAAIMLGPPLFFNEVQTGYMYTGAFIGAVIGFLIAGVMSDTSAKLMTKWNKGTFEPEFRLVLVIPQLILGCAGLYGFGITSNNTNIYGWFWPDFFFALEVAGMVIGAVASALYLIDAHRDIAVETFTCLLIFKNIFSFGLTFSGYGWLVSFGTKPVFMVIASVQVGICLAALPLYVFGKRNRSFWARHDLLRICGLK